MVTTSLSPAQASAAEIVVAYRRLLEVESTFRVLKDLIELRPVFHWTEDRVRAHVAVCVLAAVIEALMEADLRAAGVGDPAQAAHGADAPGIVDKGIAVVAYGRHHRRRTFPSDAASLLPGLLAATRTGLPPVGDDELVIVGSGQRPHLQLAGRTNNRG